MKIFKNLRLFCFVLIVMTLPLNGVREAYSADPAQLEKDKLFLNKYEEIKKNADDIGNKLSKSEDNVIGLTFAPLIIPFGAAGLTYETLYNGSKAPITDQVSLQSKLAIGAVSAAAGAVGVFGGAVSVPFAAAYAPYEGYHFIKSKLLKRKLDSVNSYLEDNKNEATRIKNKHTPLTWAVAQTDSWEIVKNQIDSGADFSDQDSVNGPIQSAATLAKAKFPQYTPYMIEHEKKISHQILHTIDSVCVPTVDSAGMKIAIPLEVVGLITSYVSNETPIRHVRTK